MDKGFLEPYLNLVRSGCIPNHRIESVLKKIVNAKFGYPKALEFSCFIFPFNCVHFKYTTCSDNNVNSRALVIDCRRHGP